MSTGRSGKRAAGAAAGLPASAAYSAASGGPAAAAHAGNVIGSVEAEIERAREDGNWKRMVDLAESQLRQRPADKHFETLAHFLIGEGKLEDYLEDHPPKESNIRHAEAGLEDARQALSRALGDDAKRLGVHLDSYILLGKLHYATGKYTEALKFYDCVQLDALEERSLPIRSLRIMAEAFAVKGLCLEKVSPPNRAAPAAAAAAAAKCLETAADLTIRYLQTVDRAAQLQQPSGAAASASSWSVASAATAAATAAAATAPPSSSPVPPSTLAPPSLTAAAQTPSLPSGGGGGAQKIGLLLETAVLRASGLGLHTARPPQDTIRKCREMLQAEESESTKGLRRDICRRLAELLLHGVSDDSYALPPPPPPPLPTAHRQTSRHASTDQSIAASSMPTAAAALANHQRASRTTSQAAVQHVGIGAAAAAPSPIGQQLNAAAGESSPWKPWKQTANAAGGGATFVPNDKYEEIILLLLLSEYIASKEAVLSQSPEFAESRRRSFENAAIIYNLMAVVLARFGQLRLLCEMLEHSMKFSFNEPHTWSQFALALAHEGRSLRALALFRQIFRQDGATTGNCLVAARLCYEKLSLSAEGLEWARRALAIETAGAAAAGEPSTPAKGAGGAGPPLPLGCSGRTNGAADPTADDSPTSGAAAGPVISRCHQLIGLGQTLVSYGIENRAERKHRLSRAAAHFAAAVRADPHDHLAEFYLAWHLAQTRHLDEAGRRVRKALGLHPEHLPSLHLLILVLTARNDLDAALAWTERTLNEFPENINILLLKVRIEACVRGGESAIRTTKDMLRRWQAATASAGSSADSGIGPDANDGCAANRSSNNIPYAFDALSDKDSASLHAHSISASAVERTLSDVASSLSGPHGGMGAAAASPGPPACGGTADPAAYTLFRVWLLGAELHEREGNIGEAEDCVKEASKISPMSHHVMFIKGLLKENRGLLEEARQHLEDSLAVNPSHVPSLHRLGAVHHANGNHRLAEQNLRVAVRLEPLSSDLWSLLGCVHEAIGLQILRQIDSSSSEADNAETQREQATATGGYRKSASLSPLSESGRPEFYLGQSSQELVDPPPPPQWDSEEESEVDATALNRQEAEKCFKRAADCLGVAESVAATSPVMPFSSIPLCFE